MICPAMTVVLIIGLFHLATGLLVARRWLRPANATELLLCAGLVAYCTFYTVPLMAGWASGYMNGWIIGLGAAAAAGLSAAAVLVGRTKTDVAAAASEGWSFQPKAFVRNLFRWQRIPELVLLLGIAVVLLFLGLAGSQLPARTYDAPYYHIVNAMRWHQTGRFILDSYGDVSLSAQAVSAECAPNVKAVLPFMVMLFSKGIAGTNMGQFPYLLLLLAAVRAICLRLNCRPFAATLAAFSVLVVPEIFLQSIEIYADLAFAAGQMVLCWALLYLWQERFSWRGLVLPAVGFGILAGAKAAVLVAGGGMGMLFGLILIWKTWPIYRFKTIGPVAVGLVLTFGIIFVNAAPWLLHAWGKFHNPFFPFEIKLGNHLLFEGPYAPNVNAQMQENFTGTKGRQAYWNTITESWRSPGMSNWAGGFGAAFFIIGIPAAVLFLMGGMWRGPAASSRRWFVTMAAVLITTTPTLAVARFALSQPICAFIALAWLLSVFPLVFRGVVAAGVLASCGYSLYLTAPSVLYRQRPPELVAFDLLSGFPRAAQCDIYPDQYTALDFWREEVSQPGLRLAYPPSSIAVFYAYAPWSPADIERVPEPATPAQAGTWYKQLLEAGATHLYAQRGSQAFTAAMDNPNLFKLMIRRLDGQYFKMNLGFVAPWPEDALFEIKRPGA